MSVLSPTVRSSQSAYSGSPPILLGSSLDLPWALWGQLRLRSGLALACTCFQSPPLPPKVHSLKQLGEYHPNLGNLLWLHKQVSFLFSHTTPGVLHFVFGPACVCKAVLWHLFPTQTRGGRKKRLFRAHLLSVAREG